jgi:uncharacterized membrane protein YgcG
MKEVLGVTGPEFKPSWKPTAALIVAGLALIGISCLSGTVDMVSGIVGTGALLPVFIVSRVLGVLWRKRLVNQLMHFIFLMIPMAIMLVQMTVVLLGGFVNTGMWVLAGLSLLCIAVFHSVLNAAKSRENGEQIAFRKKYAAAREYFRVQLASANPALDDAWYPYLLAFGLGQSVDNWFRAYGGHGSTAGYGMGSTSTGSGIGCSGGTSWTGGGGAFGGAGASASWVAVAGSMAAGVAAPSSSSSGGGGGGGSSGGGGGGGW